MDGRGKGCRALVIGLDRQEEALLMQLAQAFNLVDVVGRRQEVDAPAGVPGDDDSPEAQRLSCKRDIETPRLGERLGVAFKGGLGFCIRTSRTRRRDLLVQTDQ